MITSFTRSLDYYSKGWHLLDLLVTYCTMMLPNVSLLAPRWWIYNRSFKKNILYGASGIIRLSAGHFYSVTIKTTNNASFENTVLLDEMLTAREKHKGCLLVHLLGFWHHHTTADIWFKWNRLLVHLQPIQGIYSLTIISPDITFRVFYPGWKKSHFFPWAFKHTYRQLVIQRPEFKTVLQYYVQL